MPLVSGSPRERTGRWLLVCQAGPEIVCIDELQ